MKYSKIFNNHDEYVAYKNSTGFVRPNVSYCIQEDRTYCTSIYSCGEVHEYAVIGEPTYPSTVDANATSFDMSFNYSDTYTARTCEESSITTSTTVSVAISANPTTSARTINGNYVFHGINIPYSVEQEAQTVIPYEQRYLTFNITSGGTIRWAAYGSNYNKVIQYSINDGEWASITASSTTAINVATNDVVRFKGTNSTYAGDKNNYAGFDSGGTAYFNIEGNIMSLIYGDNFVGQTAMTGTYNFCSIFKSSKVVSAENLILPATTLTDYCYRAMFSYCTNLTTAPELPATTLADSCYWYMFENCAITTAPVLNARTIVAGCYGHMFEGCTNLNYIKCLVTSGFGANSAMADWAKNVSDAGTFVKDRTTVVGSGQWTYGNSGIPSHWTIVDDGTPDVPTISCDGFEIELYCSTTGASIYYQLDNSGSYSLYTTAITITADTYVECYSVKDTYSSATVSQTCEYDSRTIFEYANQSLSTWMRSGSAVTVPNSVNAIDGHSSNYAKGTFNYETSVNLRDPETTYLWFQHADQSAVVYVDNVQVEKHWGGYNAFFVDISNYVHKGTNNIKVALKNNEGNVLAPYAGDFNFNATLGNVKLFTSPVLPAMNYGYDGFHITSTVSTASATVNIATTIPTGATVVCTISGDNCNYSATSASTGEEMIFTTTINNPHLWNGKLDVYLYNVKLEIYYNNELYHRYERPYGLRFYEYVINDTTKYGTQENPYTGFLLNGQPYLLRGVCMHDDIEDRANALCGNDFNHTFETIYELGCNFIRLAHYPHVREIYDACDQMGIIVQTEVPWVNKSTTGETEDYWTHLSGQCEDMVNQHYNHPCIMFWGVGNEINTNMTTTNEGRDFIKGKIEGYRNLIRGLMPNAMVGYTVSHGTQNGLSTFNYPTVDWIGQNIYVGWYIEQTSNNPTGRLNTAINNTLTANTALAFSEYGCGGTQRCHSESASTTTNKGSNGARHDIEYMMWLHEGHIAAIKNKPELLFSSQWQLFDVAVSNRNEGYTVCLDGENTSTDDSLSRLNDKGLVERDHVTKKDPFYLYKAWWNQTPFVHICGKNYTKTNDRVIKCYTNEETLTLYVNNVSVQTVSVLDHIAEFTASNFSSGDVVRVDGDTNNVSDTFTFA